MGDISQHFNRSEFACSCGCGFDTVDAGLIKALEEVRRHFDRPVSINSGCRCESHNRVVGGADSSQHLRGRAADIWVKDTPPHLVAELADQLDAGGVGDYGSFTHIDTRHGRSRWSG